MGKMIFLNRKIYLAQLSYYNYKNESDKVMDIVIYVTIFIFAIFIGSFLNVCIYRIPKKESIVFGRSYCTNCNETLKWYDMVPIFSFLLLKRKCRFCKSKVSFQYPIVEGLNGILYMAVFYVYGWSTGMDVLLNIIYCFIIFVLIIISVIDNRTYTIPLALNTTLYLLGLILVLIKYFAYDRSNKLLLEHIIGFFAISLFLAAIFYITKGKGIGGGDVKLMAGAGLILGWKLVLLSFILSCIFASLIHLIRMKVKKVDSTLAFGPYLCLGIIVVLLFGNDIINWYISNII